MAKFEELAVRYMVDLISDFDLLDFQAAAIPGNGGEESAGFTKTQEINPLGGGAGGLGHFQWTGRSSTNNRRLLFEQWLARNADKGWTADTYEANYSMLFRELVGTERAAMAALKQTTTLEQATEVFMNKFERPGVPHLDVRIDYARRALAAFKAAGSPTKVTAPPQIEVLPPLPKIDPNALAPIVNTLLPMLVQMLTARAQQQGTTQPGQQPDILSVLLPLLSGLGQRALPPPTPPAPTPEPPVVVTKSPPKTSVGLGLLGLFGSAIGMSTNPPLIGTPFGFGSDPTTAGTLAVLIPAAISAVGATGIFGPWGAIAGRVIGAVGTAVANKPKT